MALFHTEDLGLVNIADEAALLADSGTLRVALRRPRLPEDDGCVARVTTVVRNKKPVRSRKNVMLAAAIRRLGLTLAAAAGKYELTTKDDLLVVDLGKARE